MRVNEIASFCGISRQQYYQIKKGLRPVPGTVAERLSKATGVSPKIIKKMSPQEFISFADRQTQIIQIVKTLERAETAINAFNTVSHRLNSLLR